MGASKRSNYSAGSGRGAGAEAARNLGVVLGLGGLSFFLGFFVLSRMVPDKHDTSGLAPSPAVTTHDTAPVPTPTPDPAPREARTVAAAPASRRNDNGPELEPATEPATQTPGSIDSAKPSHSDTSSANPADSAETGANPATGATGETGSASSTTSRTRRHSRTTMPDASSTNDKAQGDTTDNGGFSQEDQKPSRIDRDASGDAPSRTTRHTDADTSSSHSDRNDSATGDTTHTATPAKRARYSVRGSAYSRREAAEREVRRITDIGLEATVVPVTTEDGTTVYRVQQGVYRNRSNAEKAKTKLSDAGVEAEIVKTSGQ